MRIRSIFLLSVMLFYSCNVLFTQEPALVKRSHNKILIEGKPYYIHTIEEKQTLYSISRAYAISVDIIVSENPFTSEGIKVGQVLKIPAVVEMQIETDLPSDNIHHIVKEGETVYSIARRYNLNTDRIIELNPELNTSPLQLNQVLRIPVAMSNVQNDSAGKIFKEHKVERKETFFSLSKLYNISIEDILNANPTVNEDGLKTGQIIIIPEIKLVVFPAKVPLAIDNTTLHDSSNCDTSLRNLGPFKVALLLPFFLDENNRSYYQLVDSVSSGTKAERGKNLSFEEYVFPRSMNAIEFYQGALIALDTLRKEGISVELNTYDTKKDSLTTVKILASDVMKKMNLIIGPAYTHDVRTAALFAKQNKIPLVSPLSSQSNILDSNHFIFQINPNQEYEIEQAIKYIASMTNFNIILIYSPYIVDYDIVRLFKNKIERFINVDSVNPLDSVTMIAYEDDGRFRIGKALSASRKNLIIIPSERETFVSSVIADMGVFANEYRIQLLGLPNWPNFRNIDLDHYYEFEMIYYTPFMVDFYNKDVISFISKYRKTMRTDIHKIAPEGYNYSLLGYDIFYTFIKALAIYGSDFKYCLNNNLINQLQTKFWFSRKDAASGFENRTIHFYQYTKDFEIIHLNQH